MNIAIVNVFPTFVAAILLFVFCSCGRNSSEELKDRLPRLTIEIPNTLKSNQEVVDLVIYSENTLNQFSATIDEIFVDHPYILRKDQQQMSISEKLKLMEFEGQIQQRQIDFCSRYTEFERKIQQTRHSMTDKQQKALEEIENKLANRKAILDRRVNRLKLLQ